MSEPREPEVSAEFAAFREEFLDHVLEGLPEDEKQMWRDLR